MSDQQDPTIHTSGCGDHGCEFDPPAGMGTNGGCRCLKHIQPTALRLSVLYKVRRLKRRADRMEALLQELVEAIDGGGDCPGELLDLVKAELDTR